MRTTTKITRYEPREVFALFKNFEINQKENTYSVHHYHEER